MSLVFAGICSHAPGITGRAHMADQTVVEEFHRAYRGMAAELAAATGVQVLNTKAIGIRFAETCVAFKMAQSAITYPRAKLDYADFSKRL